MQLPSDATIACHHHHHDRHFFSLDKLHHTRLVLLRWIPLFLISLIFIKQFCLFSLPGLLILQIHPDLQYNLLAILNPIINVD